MSYNEFLKSGAPSSLKNAVSILYRNAIILSSCPIIDHSEFGYNTLDILRVPQLSCSDLSIVFDCLKDFYFTVGSLSGNLIIEINYGK